jgi:NTE family protein
MEPIKNAFSASEFVLNSNSASKNSVGLVLSGGGARAAYQAGALAAINEILKCGTESPFDILTGSSAGAINASYLASKTYDFSGAIHTLWATWGHLHVEDILDTNTFTLMRQGISLLVNTGIRKSSTGRRGQHIFETEHLRAFLKDKIDFQSIKHSIETGRLKAFAINATHYHSGMNVAFFDGHSDLEPWNRTKQIGIREELTVEHVIASISIPLIFRPTKLSSGFYGDGCLRLTAPLHPAIRLGAEKILAIGIQYIGKKHEGLGYHKQSISLADVAGVLVDAIFMDSFESDVERLLRINETLSLIPSESRLLHPRKLEIIPALIIRPSQDLGKLASDQFKNFPWILKHFMLGTGASDSQGGDMISYLAFDKSYTSRLLDLGYSDSMAMRVEIEQFFNLGA